MNKELKTIVVAALENKPSTSFSADEVNEAAVKAIMAECGLSETSTARDFRAVEDKAFALIEEAIDEVLPAKLTQVLGEFAEVRQFARDAEVAFNIEKIGKNRAKLTISKGARGGIYRAAKLDKKWFSPDTSVQTVAVYVTLEELILGTVSLGELYANILEGFEEIVYKEVFDALAGGQSAAGAGYNAMTSSTPKASLGAAIDQVLPVVKAYGVPTIFGSYAALSNIYNPLASTAAGYPNVEDSSDVRRYGFVQMYKGVRCVELPNYLIGTSNDKWFYSDDKVFVVPSGMKPVKVALKGDLTLIRNTQAVGSEKWEAHKIVGVGVAMANNYAVITVSDLHD